MIYNIKKSELICLSPCVMVVIFGKWIKVFMLLYCIVTRYPAMFVCNCIKLCNIVVTNAAAVHCTGYKIYMDIMAGRKLSPI